MAKASIFDQTTADTIQQDAISEAAGNAHWAAYSAALRAGKTTTEAIQIADTARQQAVRRG